MTAPTSSRRRSIPVGDTAVGPDNEPFVIAEVSGNHNGDLQRALEIVDAAAEAGAHAIKLQTYRADTITLDAPGEGTDDLFEILDADEQLGSRLLLVLRHMDARGGNP